MDYFFYNTDAKAIKEQPRPRYNVLINEGIAAVGGDRKRFGEQLGKLASDDVLLMYENGIGVVAVGRVRERWDEKSYANPSYYTATEMDGLTGGPHEYRIKVDWFNLSDPITLGELRQRIGSPRFIPRGAISKRIVKRRTVIEEMINERCPAGLDRLTEDLKAIERQNIEATTKVALVSARIGQGEFRAQVLQMWGNCCAVTGSRTKEAIRASHIKPWRKSTDEERLDPSNGLPLVANLDALFDEGLISFERSGRVMVSPKLNTAERQILGVDAKSLAKVPSAKTSEYLAYHREHLFCR